eukprot:TRINITY_DN1333_c13_g1_i1.p1 TRINITY_DN1333_c13_g1~~TRINITY_DN1333_c13_g1_i1.p1  ORF type:complete len:279 (+),score=55.25 TRINITY_DN1333_c13_g1_i1:77-838(+)
MPPLHLHGGNRSQRPHHVVKKKDLPIKHEQPCLHNDWDNVRIKKGNHSLRCRECQAQWRVHHSYFTRCIPFLKGRCDLGMKCPNVHLNQYKEGLEERRKRFGDTVLTGVPGKILCSHGIEGEGEELNATLPQSQHPPLVAPSKSLQRNLSNVSVQSLQSLPSTMSLHSRGSNVSSSVCSPSNYYAQAASSSVLSVQTLYKSPTRTPSPPVTDPLEDDDDNEGVMQLTDEDLDMMIKKLEKRGSTATVSSAYLY